MIEYSLQGYMSTLVQRTNKTLLVEGKTDKTVISRILHSLADESSENNVRLVVDTADIIRLTADEYSDLVNEANDDIGSREIIEILYEQAMKEKIDTFGAFVDRENRQFLVNNIIIDELRGHYTIPPSLFWTRGHSIENYFIATKYFINFIKLQFPDFITPNILGIIETQMDTILLETLAICLTVQDMAIISRCKGIAKPSYWMLNDSNNLIFNSSSLCTDLIRRGYNADIQERFALVLEGFREIVNNTTDREIAQWATHGHMGIELIWSGIACLAEYNNCPSETVEQIAKGFLDYKLKVSADFWAKEISEGRCEYPEDLWKWLLSK